MKKIKGLIQAVIGVLVSPELRPAEVKVLRAVGLAVATYLGLHFGGEV